MEAATRSARRAWAPDMHAASGRLRAAGRRDFLLAAGSALSFAALIASRGAFAQSIPRIGFVRHGSRDAFSEGFQEGLRDLGYIEGKNIIVEYRWSDGKLERIPFLVDELIRLNLKVIVGAGEPVLTALHKATKSIPIVLAASQNPVGAGFAASLAQPRGNMTGTTSISPELAGKRLELLRETFPGIRRPAVLWDRAADPEQLKSARAAAKALGMPFESLELRKPDELESVLAAAKAARADALVVIGSSGLFSERIYIAILAVKLGLPAIYANSVFVEAGGLMSYGANFADLFRRSAAYVDKILKGAKPGDLPIEQPTRFELVLNVKTAKLLGVTFPPEIRVRADRVIE